MSAKFQVFFGTFVDTPSFGQLRIQKNVYICVNDGIICYIAKSFHLLQNYVETNKIKFHISSIFDTNLANNELFVPGFVDTHTHPCQYVNMGKALDIPLIKWLNKYCISSLTS